MDEDAFCELVEPKVVIARYDECCGWCREPIVDRYELDHIVPLSMHGEHSYRNIQPLHRECHKLKTQRDRQDKDWWRRQQMLAQIMDLDDDINTYGYVLDQVDRLAPSPFETPFILKRFMVPQ